MNVPIRELEALVGCAARDFLNCQILFRPWDKKKREYGPIRREDDPHDAAHQIVRKWCRKLESRSRPPRRGRTG